MLKKICAAALGAVMAVGAGSIYPIRQPSRSAFAAESLLPTVNSLPEAVLNETFDFASSDLGKNVAGWNGWSEHKGNSGTLDSEITLGRDSDGNKVAVLERTAASTTSSRDYQVKKSVDIGYGTEKIGIGLRIKSMDTDNGNFSLILETDSSAIVIQVDLRNSRIITPQIKTPFIPLSGNINYEIAALDKWHTVEIIIDTNIKQIDFYTDGIYRDSSDIEGLSTSYGGDVLNGRLRYVSISTTRTTGVASGGDSARLYVDDVTVKTTAASKAKITQTQESGGKLVSVTSKVSNAEENGKLIVAAYEYISGGVKLAEARITDLMSGKISLTDGVEIPENGEVQIYTFGADKLNSMATVVSKAKNQTYYISPDGNDASSGTKMRPWKTLHKAVKEAKAGDTIILADGKYYESYAAKFKSGGTADAPIVIKAENHGKAEIIYSAYTSEKTKLYVPDGMDYITVEGLCFSQEKPATDEKITSDIYLMCEGDYCNIIGNSFTGALEEGIKLYKSDNTIVANNYVEKMVHEGIDVFNSDSVKVYNNEIHNVSRIGILAKGNTRNSQIYNNLVHNSTADMLNCAYSIGGISDNTSPYDINKDTGYECYSTAFYNNIALAHGSGTINAGYKWYGSIDCRLYNNIAIGVKEGIYFSTYTSHWKWSPRNVNPIARNNIFYNCEKAYRYDTDSIHSYDGNVALLDLNHNLFYNCGNTDFSGIINKDPQFVCVPDDFHLKEGSAAIGSGAQVDTAVPKYILNEEKTTITKSANETVNIEFNDKDGKKRTPPYDMGVYEFN